jgi:hypothetical protein
VLDKTVQKWVIRSFRLVLLSLTLQRKFNVWITSRCSKGFGLSCKKRGRMLFLKFKYIFNLYLTDEEENTVTSLALPLLIFILMFHNFEGWCQYHIITAEKQLISISVLFHLKLIQQNSSILWYVCRQGCKDTALNNS